MVLGNPRNPENRQHLQSPIRKLHRALETHGLRWKTNDPLDTEELTCSLKGIENDLGRTYSDLDVPFSNAFQSEEQV
jgi:hypothetical protein